MTQGFQGNGARVHKTLARAWQERLGVQLPLLLEDPEGATVRGLAREARALLQSAAVGASGAGRVAPAPRSAWIAPAPASVRLRLFCLPYAGGVSENVYAKRATQPATRLGWRLIRGKLGAWATWLHLAHPQPYMQCESAYMRSPPAVLLGHPCWMSLSRSKRCHMHLLRPCSMLDEACAKSPMHCRCCRSSMMGPARGRWATLLPACIQVCPVEIPGRGRREGEPALTDAAELARLLARSLPLQARPARPHTT